MDPDVMLFDEPTSALDAGTEKIITESLERLMEGRTTIIIAHRLSTVMHANRIITMTGANRTTTGNGCATLIYSGSALRWILISFDP